MEAAKRFSPNHFLPHHHTFQTKPTTLRRRTVTFHRIGTPRVSLNRSLSPNLNRSFAVNFFDRLRSEAESPNEEEVVLLPSRGGEAVVPARDFQLKPRMFRNRFLNFVRFGSVINGATESFFKSEIRRRLFVTAVLIVISRVGYFIPLPGFDRRLIPQDYMSFVSGSSVASGR